MPRPLAFNLALVVSLFALAAQTRLRAAEPPVEPPAPDAQAVAAEFNQKIKPFVARYCQKCHTGDEPEGQLAFDGFLERAAIGAGF